MKNILDMDDYEFDLLDEYESHPGGKGWKPEPFVDAYSVAALLFIVGASVAALVLLFT